jgi:hypothetical protein
MRAANASATEPIDVVRIRLSGGYPLLRKGGKPTPR